MKPYISKKNKTSRLNFATEHIVWTEELWDCVPFINESKFNLFRCDRRRLVRCSNNERYSRQCTKSCVKLEGGVIVFGMKFIAGTRPPVSLHGKINATEILKQHVVPNLRTAFNQPVVFMQDNFPN